MEIFSFGIYWRRGIGRGVDRGEKKGDSTPPHPSLQRKPHSQFSLLVVADPETIVRRGGVGGK